MVQMSRIRNEQRNITRDSSEIQTIKQEYFKYLYPIWFEDQKEINEFLYSFKLLRVNQ